MFCRYEDAKDVYEIRIAILDLQRDLLKETYELIKKSFEFQFVDSISFEQIAFLVVCYRKFEVNEQFLEDCIYLMEIDEDLFLDTIQDLFNIHNKPIPDSLISVIEFLSKIL